MNANRDQRERTPLGPAAPAGGTLVTLLVIIGIIGLTIAMLLPALRTPREPSRRATCANNLKQIAIALKNFEAVHHELPPAYTTDANGRPLHSWRTLILPFMEDQKLYDSIDLTKPWDDPANAAALKNIPSVYQCPSTNLDDRDTRTTYLAVITPNSWLRASEPRKASKISDKPKETLMVIEVDESRAVPWMSPQDADEELVLALGGPKARTNHPAGMNAAFVDGHVEFLRSDMRAAERFALISADGNDKTAEKSSE